MNNVFYRSAIQNHEEWLSRSVHHHHYKVTLKLMKYSNLAKLGEDISGVISDLFRGYY